jgi:RNA polymerase sigma-70 factor, ECF subfamily
MGELSNGDVLTLVADCLRGKRAAFRQLHDIHAGRVRAYFARAGFSRADIDDLTQDVFLRTFRSLNTFDPHKAAFVTWVAAIARNVARRQFARRDDPANFDPDLAEHVFALHDNPCRSAARIEELHHLAGCVGGLTDELSQLLHLRYDEALSTRGISERAGIPESTVRFRLGEARRLLKLCLTEKGVF